VHAPQVAAEIEHGLMIRYLFPALAMKKRAEEGLTAPQMAAARRCEGVILRVAVEEMGHRRRGDGGPFLRGHVLVHIHI
jgi:hypothetical protein